MRSSVLFSVLLLTTGTLAADEVCWNWVVGVNLTALRESNLTSEIIPWFGSDDSKGWVQVRDGSKTTCTKKMWKGSSATFANYFTTSAGGQFNCAAFILPQTPADGDDTLTCPKAGSSSDSINVCSPTSYATHRCTTLGSFGGGNGECSDGCELGSEFYIGVVLLIALVVGCCCCCCIEENSRRKKKEAEEQKAPEASAAASPPQPPPKPPSVASNTRLLAALQQNSRNPR